MSAREDAWASRRPRRCRMLGSRAYSAMQAVKSSASMEFDNERSLLLIELYRSQRSLWDPKDPLYYSHASKAQAWEEVAARVGGSVHEVRRKMESLLGSFRRERSRTARAAARGQRRNYTSSWFAYDKMRFLINRENPKKPRLFRMNNTLEDSEDVGAGGLQGPEGCLGLDAAGPFLEGLHSALPFGVGEALLEEPLETKPSALVPPRASSATRDTPSQLAPEESWGPHKSTKSGLEATQPTEEEQTDFIISDAWSACPDTKFQPAAAGAACVCAHACPTHANDEAAAFGLYVASKLRGYPPHARAVVEHLVSNVLFEADLGKHEEGGPGGQRASGETPPPVVVSYRPRDAAAATAAATPTASEADDGEGDDAPVKTETDKFAMENFINDSV